MQRKKKEEDRGKIKKYLYGKRGINKVQKEWIGVPLNTLFSWEKGLN